MMFLQLIEQKPKFLKRLAPVGMQISEEFGLRNLGKFTFKGVSGSIYLIDLFWMSF